MKLFVYIIVKLYLKLSKGRKFKNMCLNLFIFSNKLSLNVNKEHNA